MKLAYILFEGITLLDFIGAYHPLAQLQKGGFLPDFTWQTSALTPTVLVSLRKTCWKNGG